MVEGTPMAKGTAISGGIPKATGSGGRSGMFCCDGIVCSESCARVSCRFEGEVEALGSHFQSRGTTPRDWFL